MGCIDQLMHPQSPCYYRPVSCCYKLINNLPVTSPRLRVDERNVKMKNGLCFGLGHITELIFIQSSRVISQIKDKKFPYNFIV